MLNRDHAADYRCFIKGYRSEIAALKYMMAHQQGSLDEESDLLKRIDGASRLWDQFQENRAFGYEILDECYARLDVLAWELQDAEGRQTVKKTEAQVGELNTLLGEINKMDKDEAQKMVDELAAMLAGLAGGR